MSGWVLACATCFGKSDSLLAKALNGGVFTMLFVLLAVLAAFFSFVVYLTVRSKKYPA